MPTQKCMEDDQFQKYNETVQISRDVSTEET